MLLVVWVIRQNKRRRKWGRRSTWYLKQNMWHDVGVKQAAIFLLNKIDTITTKLLRKSLKNRLSATWKQNKEIEKERDLACKLYMAETQSQQLSFARVLFKQTLQPSFAKLDVTWNSVSLSTNKQTNKQTSKYTNIIILNMCLIFIFACKVFCLILSSTCLLLPLLVSNN